MATIDQLSAIDADSARTVVETLRAADFDDAHIAAVLSSDSITATGDRKLAVQRHRTGDGSVLATLIRLFVLGTPVEREAAERALASRPLDWWSSLGLVEPCAGDTMRASIQLRCFEDMIVAWDFDRRDASGRLRADYVMGVSPSSLGLAGLTVPAPVTDVLDVGTGCGIQALLAARRAERVLATDANGRAVAMAALNARLNGIANIECAEGDLFTPAGERTFDLIVSNPPFIVSPDDEHLFLSTKRPLDSLCAHLAREASGHLRDGGWCQFLANWAVGAEESWRDHVRAWFAIIEAANIESDGAGCDVFVLRRSSQPVDEYAAEWIEPTSDGQSFDATFARWQEHYARAGIAAIGFGIVTMRRRATRHSATSATAEPTWFVGEDAPDELTYPAGDAIVEAFARQDFLRAHQRDEDVLGARLRTAAGVTMTQHLRLSDGAWRPSDAIVRRDRGLRYAFDVDAAGVALLAAADGARPLAAVLTHVAQQFGLADDALYPDGPAIVRALVERGVLVPAS